MNNSTINWGDWYRFVKKRHIMEGCFTKIDKGGNDMSRQNPFVRSTGDRKDFREACLDMLIFMP